MPGEAEWAKRRAKRRKRVGLLDAEHAAARREVAKQRGRYKAHRAGIARLRETPEAERTPEWERRMADHERLRDQARKELLAAQRDVDEARDKLRAARALLAQATRKLRQLRKPKLKVYSRAEWGALPPRGSYSRNAGIHTQVLHHTAMPTPSASNTLAEDCAVMREIQRIHFANGWTDIAYHRVALPSGRIFEGRPSWAIGAHVLNHNTGTVGISCAGNYEASAVPPALVPAAAKAASGLPGSSARMVGHYQLGPTACPGKNLKPKVGEIARRR